MDDEAAPDRSRETDPRRFAICTSGTSIASTFAPVVPGPRLGEDVTAGSSPRARQPGRFEWRGVPFAAWLLQIARNALADRWQRATREHAERPVEASEDGMGADADRRAMLSDLVSRLPADQQRVVLERFVEQKSIREIARASATEGALSSASSRARGLGAHEGRP